MTANQAGRLGWNERRPCGVELDCALPVLEAYLHSHPRRELLRNSRCGLSQFAHADGPRARGRGGKQLRTLEGRPLLTEAAL